MVASLNSSEYYALPKEISRAELLRKLAADHSCVLEAPKKKKEEFFDTFDRRLHGQNLVLIKDAGSYYLKDLTGGNIVEAQGKLVNSDPKFWWDFPKCGLRKKLNNIIDMRALLSLASIERSVTTLRRLNDDKKTVLFIYVKDLKVLNNTNDNYALIVQTQVVRGYEKESEEFDKYLKHIGLIPKTGDMLSALESNFSRYPLDYSSKINVKLRPRMNGSDATKVILLNLLQTMEANEFGIKEDIDTEFLHDFRVAVRRTRSALSQIKEVFPPEITEHFKTGFSEIGTATNALRDLDVYLLTEDSYKKMLPDDLRTGLDPLFESLVEQRAQAKKSCIEFLESDSYKEIITSWKEFLNSSDTASEKAIYGDTPVIDIAKEHIWKKYSKIIKQGSKITNSTPDPKLHNLRIECKKLRYLLEFFTSLFPERDMKIIIKHLKKLQDNLGDFNDLCVQQESLKTFLTNHNIGYDHAKANTQAAAGGLISVLYQKQLSVRKKFTENFEEFSDKETTELFEKLFSGG